MWKWKLPGSVILVMIGAFQILKDGIFQLSIRCGVVCLMVCKLEPAVATKIGRPHAPKIYTLFYQHLPRGDN